MIKSTSPALSRLSKLSPLKASVRSAPEPTLPDVVDVQSGSPRTARVAAPWRLALALATNLFYTRADGKYNWYAKIMHQFAIAGNDDIYGQDPTLVAPVHDVNRVVITIPHVERLTSD